MTTEQLDHLEQLAEAATAGPWVSTTEEIHGAHGTYQGRAYRKIVVPMPSEEHGEGIEAADLAFIAAAREAVPQLIQAVRAVAPQWVAVTEALPKPLPKPLRGNSVSYWPVAVLLDGQPLTYVAIYTNHLKEWRDLQTEELLTSVTHWQYLPAAPLKGGSHV